MGGGDCVERQGINRAQWLSGGGLVAPWPPRVCLTDDGQVHRQINQWIRQHQLLAAEPPWLRGKLCRRVCMDATLRQAGRLTTSETTACASPSHLSKHGTGAARAAGTRRQFGEHSTSHQGISCMCCTALFEQQGRRVRVWHQVRSSLWCDAPRTRRGMGSVCE